MAAPDVVNAATAANASARRRVDVVMGGAPVVGVAAGAPQARPALVDHMNHMTCGSICASPGKRSTEISTALVLPVFFHQCEVPFFSGATSPARCTMGTAQL